MEFIALLVVVFGFFAVGAVLQAAQKTRQERLNILKDALKQPDVDAETKRAIIENINGNKSWTYRWLFGVGWIGLFLGVGLLLTDDRKLFVAGAVISALGFALITMPIAFRELERKRA